MMNKIKKFLVVSLLAIMCFGMCSCDGDDLDWVEKTRGDFIDNVEYQIIDAYCENIYVYTFTDTGTGKEYLMVSNCDGIQLVERNDAESEYTDGFEWEDETE